MEQRSSVTEKETRFAELRMEQRSSMTEKETRFADYQPNIDRCSDDSSQVSHFGPAG